MEIRTARFMDRLTRARELEEIMAGRLIELMQPELLDDTIPEKKKAEIRKILSSIEKDTDRHKNLIAGLLEEPR